MIYSLLILLSWFFLIIGIIGLFRIKGIYERLLSSSKIDSVTVITLIFALIIRSGYSFMTIKLLIILIFYMLTNPIANQIVASSAFKHGVKPKSRM